MNVTTSSNLRPPTNKLAEYPRGLKTGELSDITIKLENGAIRRVHRVQFIEVEFIRAFAQFNETSGCKDQTIDLSGFPTPIVDFFLYSLYANSIPNKIGDTLTKDGLTEMYDEWKVNSSYFVNISIDGWKWLHKLLSEMYCVDENQEVLPGIFSKIVVDPRVDLYEFILYRSRFAHHMRALPLLAVSPNGLTIIPGDSGWTPRYSKTILMMYWDWERFNIWYTHVVKHPNIINHVILIASTYILMNINCTVEIQRKTIEWYKNGDLASYDLSKEEGARAAHIYVLKRRTEEFELVEKCVHTPVDLAEIANQITNAIAPAESEIFESVDDLEDQLFIDEPDPYVKPGKEEVDFIPDEKKRKAANEIQREVVKVSKSESPNAQLLADIAKRCSSAMSYPNYMVPVDGCDAITSFLISNTTDLRIVTNLANAYKIRMNLPGQEAFKNGGRYVFAKLSAMAKPISTKQIPMRGDPVANFPMFITSSAGTAQGLAPAPIPKGTRLSSARRD